jgi:hypothetical protein
MNIIKGIDRIALVVAIVAIVPGALLGGVFVLEVCKTETPEHKAWQEKVEGWYQAEAKLKYRSIPLWIPTPGYNPPEEWKEPRPKYKYRPVWQQVLGGVVAAPLSFFIVLYGIRGAIRGIKWFSQWIIKGFKD